MALEEGAAREARYGRYRGAHSRDVDEKPDSLEAGCMSFATSLCVGFGGIGVCVGLAYVLDKVAKVCFALHGEMGAPAEGESRG